MIVLAAAPVFGQGAGTAPAPVDLSPGAAEVVKLSKAGMGDDVVLAYIRSSQSLYNLSADDVLYLRNSGLSGPVLTGMLNHDGALRSQQNRYVYDQKLYGPGAPPAAPPGPPPTAPTAPTAPPAPVASAAPAGAPVPAGGVATATTAAPPGTAAPAGTEVTQAPPATLVEVVPSSPGPAYYWVPGYWAWRGHAWFWVGGAWALRPRPGVVWVGGHWDHRGRGWIWVDGGWR
jgi:hypothetical protein